MFYLAPHPKLDRARRGSPRMFTIDWVEKYFSRVRPWHVIAIWVPFSLYCGWRATAGVSALGLAWRAAVGVLTWTLLEYLLHRWVFHFKPDPESAFQTDASWLIHGIHHEYPWDADRLVMPPTVSALITLILWLPFRALWGTSGNFAFFSGLVAGYVAYDLIHYYVHHATPTTALGKWLRRYHLVHHFQTPEIRYGISTPLWDFVFRTYPKDRYQGLPDDEKRLEAGA